MKLKELADDCNATLIRLDPGSRGGPRYEVIAKRGMLLSGCGTHTQLCFGASDVRECLRYGMESCTEAECDWCSEPERSASRLAHDVCGTLMTEERQH